MKRILSLFLAAVVLVVSLAVPSYAADFDNIDYINLFDYMTFDRVTVKANTPTDVTFDLPLTGIYYFIDIVVVSNNLLDQVDFIYNEQVVPLNVVQLSSELFRVYGAVRCGLSTLTLRITNRYQCNLDIQSFNVTYTQASHFNTAIEAIGSCGSTDIDMSLNWGDSRPTNITFSSTFPDVGFNLTVIPRDWYKYDFLDIVLYAKVASISSISCNKGSIVVPFTSSVVAGTGGSDAMYVISVRLDLRGLDRDDLGTNIELVITGMSIAEDLNQLALFAASGFVLTETLDPLTYFFTNLRSDLNQWFYNLQTSIDSLLDAFVGDSTAAEDFKNEVSDNRHELDDMSAAMDSFTVPDLNSINADVGQFVSAGDINSLSAPMALLFESDLVVTCIMISLILATVMFVLYGKR